jgi:hypothetical protein
MLRWIYWPDEAEKATLASRFYRLAVIRGTWGPIAGETDAYFAWKPLLRGDSRVGRKGRCGFNRLKVVDIDGLVGYAVEGYGSNVGD